MLMESFFKITAVWGIACLTTFITGVIVLKYLVYPLFYEFPLNIPKFFRKEIGFFKLIDPIVKFSVWFMSLFAIVLVILLYFDKITYFITFNIMTVSIPLKFGLASIALWAVIETGYQGLVKF